MSVTDILFFRIAVIEDGRTPTRIQVMPCSAGLALVRTDRSRTRLSIADAEPVAGQGEQLDGPAYRLSCGALTVRAPRVVIDYLLQKIRE